MSRNFSRNAFCSLFVAAATMTTPVGAAPVDCAAPRGIEQQRACKAAQAGVDSLRRFSERTRMIYQIHVHDYSSAFAPSATAKPADATRTAERK